MKKGKKQLHAPVLLPQVPEEYYIFISNSVMIMCKVDFNSKSKCRSSHKQKKSKCRSSESQTKRSELPRVESVL